MAIHEAILQMNKARGFMHNLDPQHIVVESPSKVTIINLVSSSYQWLWKHQQVLPTTSYPSSIADCWAGWRIGI